MAALEVPDAPDAWSDSDAWEPEDGESITGTVTKRETATSKRYDTEFEILHLRNGSGDETKILGARSHLASLIAEHDPQPGDEVAIRHWDPAPGTRAHLYALRVNKGSDADEEPPF